MIHFAEKMLQSVADKSDAAVEFASKAKAIVTTISRAIRFVGIVPLAAAFVVVCVLLMTPLWLIYQQLVIFTGHTKKKKT